ncbi:glutathione synthetase large subunit G [Schizosaccharomyces cryophilus OY26]|uniref:Glutathione synthetase n=1 Tax=Schizosaccharomyces cryophilus (strain OY26 / ATCC MYA-4695 / CBS 11777 / NBRC 106824 / NRRL Y48691) TaxID=653667 RepID=S9XHT0_SCHCR|nr:glutathione synthetase large subunit G [Schizosaccharomyces cryophilus OY26]EPY53236.1 glutathione synthetase large subunit G [Schizosaccharomyces cryophilus OY26]
MELNKYSTEEIEELSLAARDYATAHGLLFVDAAQKKEDTNGATQVPLTLFPSPVPRNAFIQGVSVQKAYNKLYAKIANDFEFLKTHLESITKYDKFMDKLWDLYMKHLDANEKLKPELRQPLALGIFRSDYMVNKDDQEVSSKQVEFNTISVSFGGLSKMMANLHFYCSSSGLYKKTLEHNYLTVNTSITGICSGISSAYNAYCEQAKGITSTKLHATERIEPIVLFVVKDSERNICDQRLLEYDLLSRFKIRSKRVAIRHLDLLMRDDESNKLYYKTPNGIFEVAIVYYRSGYALDDYPTNKEWEIRLMIENSLAIKCPTIATHLAGSKKIQQVLAESNALEKFVHGDELKAIESTFADMYPLNDTPRGQEGIKLALENSDDFVLKPQREGGGNNTYGKDIPDLLNKLPKEEWDSYILMRYIKSLPSQNYILKGSVAEKYDVVDEIGILGTIVWNTKTAEEINNGNAGYICRTKPVSSHEGGVATGYASLSSVDLID